MTLRTSSLRIFVLCLSLAIASSASAVTTAQVSVNGGAAVAIPLQSAGDPNYYCAGTSGCSNPAIMDMTAGYDITIDLYFYPDSAVQPTGIKYGIGVSNSSSSAMTFSFLFSQSIASMPAPGVVQSTLSGTTTAGGGNPAMVTVNATAPPAGVPIDADNSGGLTLPQIFTLSATGGPPLTNAGLDQGRNTFSSNPTLTTDSYGLFSESQAGPIPSGSYNFMRMDLNFSLSGSGLGGDPSLNGDQFSFNGKGSITPEPQIAALMGFGLFALGYAGRRRRR